jgi:hypothetical protein
MRWVDRLFYEFLHGLLRAVALVFSAVSAMSIYWFFSDLADGVWGMVESSAVTVAFALAGFLVMRAIALRVLAKQRLGMLIGVALVYEWVEVTANVLHALVVLPHLSWLGGLTVRWPFMWWVVVVTLSILPMTTLVLAALDADLMREASAPGRLLVGAVSSRPSSGSSVAPKPSSGPSVVNALQQYWSGRKP